jgi:hypothetical protein
MSTETGRPGEAEAIEAATTTWAQAPADPYADIQRALNSLRRTIACHPSRAEAIRADLARRDIPFVTVVESEHVPDNVLYLWPDSVAESVRGEQQ